jgi:hypothetical protein
MQCPAFDSGLPLGVCVDRAAEAPTARGDAGLRTDTQISVTRLSAMRIPCLLHDVSAVRLLHGVVPIAVEHDDWHRLH